MVKENREEGKSWVNYSRKMQKYYEEVDKKTEKRIQGLEENYQSQVVAQEIVIKELGETVDK